MVSNADLIHFFYIVCNYLPHSKGLDMDQWTGNVARYDKIRNLEYLWFARGGQWEVLIDQHILDHILVKKSPSPKVAHQGLHMDISNGMSFGL